MNYRSFIFNVCNIKNTVHKFIIVIEQKISKTVEAILGHAVQ
jgi:hypothetical protein